MSFQLPSFFKIRLILLVIAFLFLFMFVGFVKWCFAGTCLDNEDILFSHQGGYYITTGAAVLVYDAVLDPNDHDGNCDILTLSNGWTSWVDLRGAGPTDPPQPNRVLGKVMTTPYTSAPPPPPCKSCDDEYNDCLGDQVPNSKIFVDDCVDDANGCAVNPQCLDNNCDNAESVLCDNSDLTNCLFSCQTDANGYVVSASCDCNPMDCNDKKVHCSSSCGGQFNVSVFSCDPYVCQCVEPPPETPGDIDNIPDPEDEHGIPQEDDTLPPDESDPVDTDSDSLDKVVDNLAKLSDQAGKIVDNTKVIADILDAELNEVNNNLERLGQTIDSLGDDLSEINEGEYNQNSISDKLDSYGDVTEKLDIFNTEPLEDKFDFTPFSDRFNSFKSTIQFSDFFGLTDDIIFNVPSGGSSVINVDLGSYGDVDIDFAEWDSQLAILKYCFLTCFSFAGIRILVSKK